MNLPIGFTIVLALVFGGFTLSGGKMDIILHALPYESLMVGGMAVGSFIIANSFNIQKRTFQGLVRVLKGERWKKQDYEDALLLMFQFARINKSGGIQALEAHIDSPQTSDLFLAYPRILKDYFAVALITDTMKAMTMNMDDPHAAEDLMLRRLKAHHYAEISPAIALTKLSDALPAIGIVAAVLGVIKTMSSVDAPPAILGEKIGGALVGTVLGVFLSYGLVGPIATRLEQIVEKDGNFYNVLANMLLAMLYDDPPMICVEKGRSSIPDGYSPSFNDIEEKTRAFRA